MPGTSRDLAAHELWEASLQRSRARRNGLAPTPAVSSATAPPRLPRTPTSRRSRDLSDAEHWDLSIGRSRTRRRAAEIQFVPGSTRAKRLSIGALAALTAGPAVAISEASAAADGASSADVPTTTEHTLTILPGSSGAHVRSLQRALGVRVDGVFGHHTQAAVHRLQSHHGLRRDGVVGARTAAALRHSTVASAPVAATVTDVAATHHHVAAHARIATDAGGARYASRGDSAIQHGSAVAPADATPTAVPDSGAAPADAPPRTVHVRHHVDTAAAGVSAPASPPATDAPASTPTSHARVAPSAPVRVSDTGGAQAQDTAPTRPGTTGATATGTTGSDTTATGVAAVVAAGNRIARLPYRYGGGHASFKDTAYDCSGSVSYALHGAGLISSPEDSTQLESYGSPGAGKHITVYANSGHTFMTVDGRRFDTVALSSSGSRWSSSSTSTAGYVVRHPTGY